MYLNQVYFAKVLTAWQQARVYFNKPVSELDLPQRPDCSSAISQQLSLLCNLERARERRNVVLDRMAATGRLSSAEAETAKQARIAVQRRTGVGLATSSTGSPTSSSQSLRKRPFSRVG